MQKKKRFRRVFYPHPGNCKCETSPMRVDYSETYERVGKRRQNSKTDTARASRNRTTSREGIIEIPWAFAVFLLECFRCSCCPGFCAVWNGLLRVEREQVYTLDSWKRSLRMASGCRHSAVEYHLGAMCYAPIFAVGSSLTLRVHEGETIESFSEWKVGGAS